jgi:hypothetical protein
MGSPTLQTLQDLILLLPWVCFRGGDFVTFTPTPTTPTTNNTVRSFSTHGQQTAAKGGSTTVSRSDIRLIQHFDFTALWSDGPEVGA